MSSDFFCLYSIHNTYKKVIFDCTVLTTLTKIKSLYIPYLRNTSAKATNTIML